MRKLIELDGIGSKTSKLFEKLDIYNDIDLILIILRDMIY